MVVFLTVVISANTAVQIELALDRCGGRWELLAAELVAFEPDHRTRIRALKAAAELRQAEHASAVERQRRRLSVEAKVEAALLEEGYPSTPRSDREAPQLQQATPQELSVPAGDGGRSLLHASGSRVESGTSADDTDAAGDARLVRVSPLPLSGAVMSYDAAAIAVESEPTLLWASIDAASTAGVSTSSAKTSVLPANAGPAALQLQGGVAAIAKGTWGAEGYASFAWQGERDPLRVSGEALGDCRPNSSTNAVAPHEGAAEGEEAPLRDVIFRLFNDAADAALADAAAQRRRAAGE